ncbi:11516_t:CDS:1, partial [Acaulospora colombiana]
MGESWSEDQHRQRLRSVLSDPKKLSSVTAVCLSISWPDPNPEAISFIPHLRDLPRLQSLTYLEFGRQQSKQFLQELNRSCFVSLISLYIQMPTLYGPLRLEGLEVLYLDVREHSIGQWSFPSLRHLTIKKGCKGFARSLPSLERLLGEDTSPLAGPHSHLQSLILLEKD